jgi:hypothetical protein
MCAQIGLRVLVSVAALSHSTIDAVIQSMCFGVGCEAVRTGLRASWCGHAYAAQLLGMVVGHKPSIPQSCSDSSHRVHSHLSFDAQTVGSLWCFADWMLVRLS